MKKIIVSVVGGLLVVVGLIMMPLPGPGIVVVVAGIAVLAAEYAWARRALRKTKDKAEEAQREAVATTPRTALTFLSTAVGLVVGVLMFVVDDVPWPFLDSWGDAVWTPWTGGIVIATSLVALSTAVYTLYKERSGTASHA